MIDAHCHLYELEESEWNNNRLTAMISPGADIATIKKSIALSEKYANVFATVGQHPESKDEYNKKLFLEMAKNKKVVAIGECGLDSDNESEVELFKQNIDLAHETGLPIVVHCRNMFAKVFEVLDYDKVQMHCFTGNTAEMRECARRGWYISFGGIVTFKKSGELREVARLVPEELILAETDSPYLAPEPLRGSVNKPENVKIVIEKLAEVRGIPVEEMDKITSANAKRFFGL